MVGHLPIGQREHPVRVAILGPMADAQAGGPAREHRPRKPTDGHGRLLIKRRFHLIEQQHGRSCGEGPQQRHPSKLAARELSRRVIERHAIEHRQGKHLVQHVVIGLRRAGIHLQRPGKQQVVPHRAGHQRRSLRHQAHAPAPFHRLEPINGNTLERQRAARARQHERARVQQSGLSRSGRPREVVQAARLQRETHIRKGRERLPVATKLHPDMSCLE